MSRIAIIGAGAWGTGLAIVLGRKGTHQIRLWANEPEVYESIANRRINEHFLPGFILPDSIAVTSELNTALDAAEIVAQAQCPRSTVELYSNEWRRRFGRRQFSSAAPKGSKTERCCA